MVSFSLNTIVGAYDVRGLVDSELTPAVAEALGVAWVETQQLAQKTVIVGHDMRPSSPVLADSLARGASLAGATVIELGLASTDMVYYASGSLDASAVMITASHNPASYNGLKFTKPGAKGLSRANGLAEIAERASDVLSGNRPEVSQPGSREKRTILADYAHYMRKLVDLSGSTPLRIVVDAANGMAGLTVPEVFSHSSWPIEIIPMYFELDGTFPNHEANPLNPDNLVDLQAAVVAHKADAGLAFDGDADRVFVIDENGDPVTPSAIGQMVATREVSRHRATHPDATATIIHNLICSRALPEKIAALGALPHRTAVGHSLIKTEMEKTGAIFGAEHSAHYYFRDFWGADNGMLAALHVLAELGGSGQTLSQLCADYSPYAASGEVNFRVDDVDAVMARIVRQFGQKGDIDRLDGITVSSAGPQMWWFNVRSSNTEPLVRLNVEADTVADMEALRDEVARVISGES
jgi:phosphomannomutase